jgi:hypothetical protein
MSIGTPDKTSKPLTPSPALLHPEETAASNILFSPEKLPKSRVQRMGNASRVFDDAFFDGRDRWCALSGRE